MSPLSAVVRRELFSYFSTPLAYVFLTIFLVLSAVFTFQLGGLYERRQADLLPFFNYVPWLFLFILPALAMRLWAEERKTGTIELLLTLPLSLRDVVLGKFLAAWLMAGVALILTFPLWITVNYLGEPDNGIIVAAYLASWLMAGMFLAIGGCLSAATNNQVIAFIMSVVVCFLFIILGFPQMLAILKDIASPSVVDAVASLSVLVHFDAIKKGVLDIRDIIYFVVMTVAWLSATAVMINMKRAA